MDILDRLRAMRQTHLTNGLPMTEPNTPQRTQFLAAYEVLADASDEIGRLRSCMSAADEKLQALTGEPHIDGYPLYSGLPLDSCQAASGSSNNARSD